LTLESQRGLLNPDEATVGTSLSKDIHLLEQTLPVPLEQIDDMALCVVLAVDELVQHGDRGVLDVLSELVDARDERGVVVPAAVRALAERRNVVPVHDLLDRQLRVPLL
jgi:hypothetical protein